jgi:deoxyribose-phosphate aldolase
MTHLNRIIDHTLLRPDSTQGEIEEFCGEAARYQFVCVAMLPNYVADGVRLLRGTGVHVMAAISYPRGQCPLQLKRAEIEDALSRGADEIDMVLNLYAIKLGDMAAVETELRMLRDMTVSRTGKAIMETSLLVDSEIATVCELASGIGVDYVKSSTGFDGHKATVHAITCMRRHVSGQTRVKAAGGIGSLGQAVRMVQAGADRLGTSAGPAIMEELRRDGRDFELIVGRRIA